MEQRADRLSLVHLLSMRTESESVRRTRGDSRRRKTTRTRSRCMRARGAARRRSHRPATFPTAGAACVLQLRDVRLRARKFRAHRCSCAAYYGDRARLPTRKSAGFIEKCSAAAQRTGRARGSVFGSELERARREPNLEQERRERRGEAYHRQDEQDGYDSRQVDRDEGAREKRHHHQ